MRWAEQETQGETGGVSASTEIGVLSLRLEKGES